MTLTQDRPATFYDRVAALSPRQRAILSQRLAQQSQATVSQSSLPQDPQAQDSQAQAAQSQLAQNQRLVAYAVPKDPRIVVNAAELRATLQAKLPQYMVPAEIVILLELPRTANGKIDIRALSKLRAAQPNSHGSASDDASSNDANSNDASRNDASHNDIQVSQTSDLPQTSTEKTLVKIWKAVLGLKQLGIHDNFFELGGDSILSIQIVSRAREAGLRLAPNQLFDHPTVATLATAVKAAPAAAATQSAVTGSVPLTPIQQWFFGQQMPVPQHWHQARLFELPRALNTKALDTEALDTEALNTEALNTEANEKEANKEKVDRVIAALWQHHDALRMRFSPPSQSPARLEKSAHWQAFTPDIEGSPKPLYIDLSDLEPLQQQQAVAKYSSELHAQTDLAAGPLLQAAHFYLGDRDRSWLLISLHHLVVDVVSWQILQDDLGKLLTTRSTTNSATSSDRQLAAQLPPKTTAFKHWAEKLTAEANSRVSELPFWLAQLKSPTAVLSQNVVSPSQNIARSTAASTERAAQTVTVSLAAAKTHALLQTVPAVYNTQINDALLTALCQTLLAWRDPENAATADTAPLNTLRLELEGHGREQIAPDVDLSRTVGWFTTTYPVSLQLSRAADLGESIKSIKEQLRQIPNRGIGYGLLRYSADEQIQAQLKAFAPAEILFNYLGQQQQQQPDRAEDTQLGKVRSLPNIDLGTLRSPNNPRSHPLEINAWIANGQLTLSWTYDTQCYQPSVISNIAHRYLDTLKALIAHCISNERSGYTPSDFPDLDFDQTQLDRFIKHLPGQIQNNIEAIYPLAPLQTAFLWNSLQTSAQAGLLHMRGTLHGQLDLDRLRQAWQHVVSRHPALRTSVHWEATQNPLQVVSKQIDTPWQQLDWQAYAPHETAERLTDFLERDRTLGFDLTQAPLNRLTFIRTGDRTHELIWTCHHLMLDGWSGTLVINQLLTQYNALTQHELRSETQNTATYQAATYQAATYQAATYQAATYQAATYQAYIRWRNQQDAAAAKSFWKTYLKGFITPASPCPQRSVLDSQSSALNAASTQIDRPISAFLRTHRLTFNTLIQATWALLLHCRSGQLDTLFGATVSGRQADLPDVESIVGMLINVLPVRVKITPKATVLSWLQALQNQQATASRYAYASPSQIQAWSECPTPLFDSLLVIENYPTQQDAQQGKERSLKIENLRSGIVSAYGLTLIVRPGDQPTLCAESENIAGDRLQALLTDFTSLLNKIVDGPAQPLQHILPPAQEMSALRAAQSQPPQLLPASPVTIDTPPTQLPRNPIELELIKIWESVLGNPALTPEDSFFDLGGSSLLAVQLFDQMQQQLNCTLPLATLFQAPTIRQFAAVLTQAQPVADWSSLVPIQPNGTRTPLFFHGGSADALTWARFAHLLGSDQPFYALQRPDLDGSEILHDTIESLASACIREIKMVQPKGPYAIGGHCFGGAVAFEIARQLEAQGDAIATLIEVDAYCPNAVSHTPIGHLQESLQRAHFNLRKAYYYHGGQNLTQLLPKIQQKIKHRLFPQLDVVSSPADLSEPSPADLSESAPIALPAKAEQSQGSYQDRYDRAHQASEAASQRYYPSTHTSPYTGPIHIFRAQTQLLDWHYGKAMGWQTVALRQITITPIPGLFGNLFNQKAGPLLAHQVKTHLAHLPTPEP